MRLDWSRPIVCENGLQLRQLIRLCLALLLMTMPLWGDSAHRTKTWGANLFTDATLAAERSDSSSLPADAANTAHCALYCAPLILGPTLLLCALLPLAISAVPAYARFHARLGSAPPLPPPRIR